MNQDISTKEFRKCFINYYPKVKHFVMLIIKSEDDAEDIVQEVFIKIWEQSNIWTKPDSLDNYLFRVAKNITFSFLRRKRIERIYKESLINNNLLFNELLQENDLSDKLYYKDLLLLLKLRIEQFPEQRKKVFIMSRLKGMKNSEIANILGISILTVKKHIHHALIDLKNNLFEIWLLFYLLI